MGSGCGRGCYRQLPVEPETLPEDGSPEKAELIARKLLQAMKGLGTDERGINTTLAKVQTQKEWEQVQAAFKTNLDSCTFKGGDLHAALESELSRSELIAAKKQLWGDGVDARVWYKNDVEDVVSRMYFAMKGLGTYEQDIYDALSWVKTEETWIAVQESYERQFPTYYGGNLKHAIYSELNAHDLNKAKARLRRNKVSYDDKDSRTVMPGDVIDIKSFTKDIPPKQAKGNAYKAYQARCDKHDMDLVVMIDVGLLPSGDLELPRKIMVDGTMHVAPRLLIISSDAKEGSMLAYEAEYKKNEFEPRVIVKQIGDKIEEVFDGMTATLMCRKVDDYFERRRDDDLSVVIRKKQILRAIVQWTYSVAGSLVTLATGDDKPYHAKIRLLLDGGHVVIADRTDKGIVWVVKTSANPSEDETKKMFFEGIEEQCNAAEAGQEEPLASVGDYGTSGSKPVVMLDLHFKGEDVDAEKPEIQAEKLAALVPCYTGCNPDPKPGESPDYCDGNNRKPFAKPICVKWIVPTLLQLLCGLYQVADVTYGPPTYFESYHPRKMNCQAFVFDAIFVLLTPPFAVSPFGAVVDFSGPQDDTPTAPLLRALKAHIMQDADKMLNSGGTCRLGSLSQGVAEWVMF